MDNKMLGVNQAARELGVAPNTLRAWSDEGRVPHVRLLNGYRRYSREQVEQIKQGMARPGRAATAAAAPPA